MSPNVRDKTQNPSQPLPLPRGGVGGGVDFANILFAGPCNRFCPFCIGKEIPAEVNVNNLDIFPPRNWNAFMHEVARFNIREIVFTGTTSDPHLYRHEAALIKKLRHDLPKAKLSIHTNGALTLKKIHTFNSYDRACISFPSFNPKTYQAMMGSAHIPDLAGILKEAKIPVKVSCVVNEHNAAEVDGFLRRLARMGVKRSVLREETLSGAQLEAPRAAMLRQLYGNTRKWTTLSENTPLHYYRENPVYDIAGMEVTWWRFEKTSSQSINLFADGTIGSSYLLAKTPEFAR